MIKYSEQFKLAAIQRYLAGSSGFTAVSKEIGVGVALIKRWVAFYRAHGLDGIRAKPYVRHSAEFKLKVLQHMWDNHLSYAQTAAAFDVRGQCQISTWQRSYRAGGIDALMSASEKMSYKSPDPTDQPPAAPAAAASTAPSVEPAPDNRTREQLLARIDDLEMEIAYRKKLSALVQSQQAQPARRRKRKS